MTVGHVDPIAGASGDMLLGAVLDAGADVAAVRAVLSGLGVDGWTLEVADVVRAGIGAAHARVTVAEDGPRRTWGDVRDLLSAATLPEPVRARALAVFARLAAAEGGVHRVPAEEVHFHEVGALDAIVDIVGVCAGLHHLGIERLTCGPIPLGTGSTRSAHGRLPLPAPAVLELLRGAPVRAGDVPVELCTPTGAALLAEWVTEWTELPEVVLGAVGYGAGTRDLGDRPNVLRLVVGEPSVPAPDGRAVLLETTIDDLSGELVPPVLDALRAAGAHDAWARPVVMKKGRPGIEVACLAPPERAGALRRLLFRETTTLGVRGRLVDRWTLERTWAEVDVAGAPVRLKLGWLDGEVVNVAPEHDDCAAAARVTGLPLKEVHARARAAWRG
jgi:pyridinium-3,5-bisthiocarboxylic acid mononucleotide nickel chelatase